MSVTILETLDSSVPGCLENLGHMYNMMIKLANNDFPSMEFEKSTNVIPQLAQLSKLHNW